MDTSELIFKGLAILHFAGGYLLFFGFAIDEEFQEHYIYKNRNPLIGDILKWLVILGSISLVACGFFGSGYSSVFHFPKLAVALTWISFALFVVTGVVDALVLKRRPHFCKSCAINFGIRFAAALALSWAFYHSAYA